MSKPSRPGLSAAARAELGAKGAVWMAAKPVDLLMFGGFSLCAVFSMLGRSAGWEEASAVFALIAVLPLLLRAASLHFRSPSLQLLADFSPTLGIIASYGHLDPVCDFFRQPLADGRLQHIDAQIFGFQPSVVVAAHLAPWVGDVLMLCYCSYYFWPFLLGILLYVFRDEDAFDEWSLAVMTCVLLNYACYMAVPAIGPRFALASDFPEPVGGAIAGPLFRALLHSPFRRDCFPSGHTSLTLLILWHAWRVLRRFFWVVLPIGLGLISATIALRFHYGVDLLAAIPLTAISYALSESVFRSAPREVTVLARDTSP